MTKCFDYLECSDPARCAQKGVCRLHEAEERAAAKAAAIDIEGCCGDKLISISAGGQETTASDEN